MLREIFGFISKKVPEASSQDKHTVEIMACCTKYKKLNLFKFLNYRFEVKLIHNI